MPTDQAFVLVFKFIYGTGNFRKVKKKNDLKWNVYFRHVFTPMNGWQSHLDIHCMHMLCQKQVDFMQNPEMLTDVFER